MSRRGGLVIVFVLGMAHGAWAAAPLALSAPHLRLTMTVALGWRGARHGAVPEGYWIYRRWQTGPRMRIGHTPVAVVTYTDPAPALGKNCYVVTAFLGVVESVPSNEVCVQCALQHGGITCAQAPAATGG